MPSEQGTEVSKQVVFGEEAVQVVHQPVNFDKPAALCH
jgi:hypothetical protein